MPRMQMSRVTNGIAEFEHPLGEFFVVFASGRHIAPDRVEKVGDRALRGGFVMNNNEVVTVLELDAPA